MVAIAVHEQDRRNLRGGAGGGCAAACDQSAENRSEPASKGSAPAPFRIVRRDSLIS